MTRGRQTDAFSIDVIGIAQLLASEQLHHESSSIRLIATAVTHL
jgi:hypothetical protein